MRRSMGRTTYALAAGYHPTAADMIRTPVLQGNGHAGPDGIRQRYPLRLLSARECESGNVVLMGEPTRR
jgi:hypothetical protein